MFLVAPFFTMILPNLEVSRLSPTPPCSTGSMLKSKSDENFDITIPPLLARCPPTHRPVQHRDIRLCGLEWGYSLQSFLTCILVPHETDYP